MRQENTCQFCDEKHDGCHGKCERYQEAVRKHKELKELIMQNKQKQNAADNFKIDSIRRARKKKRK